MTEHREITQDEAVLGELVKISQADSYLASCIERAKDRVAAQIQFQQQAAEIEELKRQLGEKPLKAVEAKADEG